MKMSFLHAAAALLTALLLLVQKHVLAAICSKSFKYRHTLGYENHYIENESCYKRPITSTQKITKCSRNFSLSESPKYKKDPEIHVDNEGIAQQPYDD
ncbi:unnamed protein product [Pieris macdunnoughi]|uniref:Secreted protein n=1 Tax=Pieris macdunnoughi TaxID=345717 RepID=A0A821RIT4_9NEOP|nr:unnamed protein product [Pieris macdunnoughi]